MSAEAVGIEQRARVHAALGDVARLAIVDRLAIGDISPGEVGRVLGLSTNLVAHHLGVLETAGLITRTRSEGDGRRTYLSLVPGGLSRLMQPKVVAARRVVFVCTRNSARSQLAAAVLASRSSIPVASAGTDPAERVHPLAVRVGRRHGLMLRAQPVHVRDVVNAGDLVISVCDNANEYLPADADRVHWSVPDPVRVGTADAFEAAFGEISVRVDRLVPVLSGGTS
jgi:protein-tyrosine-phosphatase